MPKAINGTIHFNYDEITRLVQHNTPEYGTFTAKVPLKLIKQHAAALNSYNAAEHALREAINKELGPPVRRGLFFNCSSG
jgi:hypothetical protein